MSSLPQFINTKACQYFTPSSVSIENKEERQLLSYCCIGIFVFQLLFVVCMCFHVIILIFCLFFSEFVVAFNVCDVVYSIQGGPKK